VVAVDKEETGLRGVQSVEISVGLLRALADAGGLLSLKELAAAVGMPAAKAHRYLASFVEAGMVDHRRSGLYQLGPMAARIGLAALARVDVVNRAADSLGPLVEETGTSALLAVLGSAGPTVVRWEQARRALVTTLGLGSVLPLTNSATGLVILAYGAPGPVADSLARSEGEDYDAPHIQALRRDVLAQGHAVALQDFIPGLFAISVPVLNAAGIAEAAITLVGTDAMVLRDPALLQALRRAVEGGS